MAKQPTPVNIRNFSVKCGRCGEYQVLVAFEPAEEWNAYIYECEWSPCEDSEDRSRTVLEVPVDLDEFANRDPGWHGGKVHAGAEARAEDGPEAKDADPESSSAGGGLLPVIKSD